MTKYHTRGSVHDRLKVRVLAYARTSTDEQKLGIEAQKKAVEKWVLESGTELTQLYEDLGYSGTLAPDKRPGLAALLFRLEKRDIDYVLVMKRDRLARDVTLMGYLEFAIIRCGARLITVDEDPAEEMTPEKKLLQGVINTLGEYERSLIALRTKAALGAAKAKGTVLGRRKRLSYRKNCILFWAIRWLSERKGCSDEFISGYLVQHAGMKLSLSTIARFRNETEIPAFAPFHDTAALLKPMWRISKYDM
jgi:DNA invertase Pin-like site-specific DNA recombinase